jgi:hypothetical protein
MSERQDRWFVGGRHYEATWASDPDGFALELDDVAPPPGRGMVLRAWRSDDTGETTVDCYVREGLPLELVERFVQTARQRL